MTLWKSVWLPLPLLLLLWGCVSTGRSGSGGVVTEASQVSGEFWGHWGDGQAEVSGYRLRQPRYGELRAGEAVLVVVTETFTHGQRVKSDGGHRDEFPVIKLNEIRDFQTGIYDYNVMTSAFLPLSGELPRGLATRISFSMQEWCGLTHAEVTARHAMGAPVEGLHLRGSGYFDGEAAVDEVLAAPVGGLQADAMPLLVRDLVGTLLPPGTSRTVEYLPRLSDSRMQHTPVAWTPVTLSRSADTAPVTVPAGTFDAYTVTVESGGGGGGGGGMRWTWQVEGAAPHRLVRWTGPDGEEGVLTGSARLRYWQQHGEGQEDLRATLGLPPVRWP